LQNIQKDLNQNFEMVLIIKKKIKNLKFELIGEKIQKISERKREK